MQCIEKEQEARTKLEALKIQMQLIAEYGRRLLEVGVKIILYKSLRHLLTCFLMYRRLIQHNDHSTMTSQDMITGSIDCSHIDSPINYLPPFNYHNYHPLLTILPIIMLVTMYVSNESSTMLPICSFDSIRWLAVD